MFAALLFAARGSNEASPLWWAAALLALWIVYLSLPPGPDRVSVLGWAIAGLALWIAGMNFFASAAYTPVASYHAALLIGGYLVGRRLDATRLCKTALAFATVVAIWALAQLVVAAEARAHGWLVAPATLAAVLNLVLVPSLVLVALGLRDARVLGMLVVLATALFASLSRGGWLALLAAGGLAFVLARRGQGIALSAGAARRIVAILVAAAIAGWVCINAASYLFDADPYREENVLGTTSLGSRLELYALAWHGLGPSSLRGAGYRSFHYRVEAERDAVPALREGTTYFVHNDYLQTLFEFGVPGFAGLLFVVLGSFIIAWRRMPQLPPRDAPVALATAAALASMGVHAVVDFPFYVPLCVLMYAIALGFFDRTLGANGSSVRPVLPDSMRRGGVAATGTLAAWVLAMPAAAEVASEYGQRTWATGQVQKAAYWLEAARRLDSRDWRYHWYVGQFWAVQAADRADREAANRADAALAASVAANTLEVRSLHTRIVVHRRLRSLLDAPADPATLRAWADHAVALAPSDPGVRAERERIWKQFGAPKGAG